MKLKARAECFGDTAIRKQQFAPQELRTLKAQLCALHLFNDEMREGGSVSPGC